MSARTLIPKVALALLISFVSPAVAENPFAKAVVKLLLEGLGATTDDAELIMEIVEKERSRTPELPPGVKLVITSAEEEYRRKCPQKNAWEVLQKRPDPPPGASEEEVTCSFLHNLHVDVLKFGLKAGPK